VNPREAGRRGERIAARYLESHGWRILAHGFRVRGGEIDLVATRDGLLAFVEVKTRRNPTLDDGRGAVNGAKQRRLTLAAGLFLARRRLGHVPCRFDVILVVGGEAGWDIVHIPGAFQA
jgi:putative endonuclease